MLFDEVMFLVGKWSPEQRSFRVRVFGNQKRAARVPAPRLARAIQAIDPATLDLSSAGLRPPVIE